MTARSVSDLAAAAETRLETAYGRAAHLDAVTEPLDDLRALLAELVARLEAAEAENERLRKIERNNSVLFDKWKAAEAQVAALTQERARAWRKAEAERRLVDEWTGEAATEREGREAAEAALAEERERFHRHVETMIEPKLLAQLADTRRALEQIAAMTHAANAPNIARRALAATGSGTTREQDRLAATEALARAADDYVWNPTEETMEALRLARGRWQSAVGLARLAATGGDTGQEQQP